MEVIGKIKLIESVKQVTDKFKNRKIVVTTDEQYPQHILIEFAQDKCSLVDNYTVGQDVKVSINLRGREWTNQQGEVKYFNSVQGWRIEANNDTSNEYAQTQPQPSGTNDDLPF